MNRDTIHRAACALRPRLVAFLREIIAIPSFSGQEGAVVRRIEQEMVALGFDEVRIDALGNVLGRLGSGGRVIAFDGHCDTVGTGRPDNWQVDPFVGAQREGVIYGRGAADQKGGIASAVYGGRIIQEIGVPDDTSVWVVASVLEESLEGYSWQHIVEKEGIVPDAVVLTEPTNRELKIGQRGRMDIKVHTRGISCHGSTPELGDNAIYKIAPIATEIEQLHRTLDSDSPLGKGSVTVSDIRSTAPSLAAVADSASIHLDRRVTQGETRELALEQILALDSVRRAEAEVVIPECKVETYTGLSDAVEAYFPAWLMEHSDPLVRRAAQVYERLFGHPAPIGVWRFSTNGVATKGKFRIPTIGFGPGKEEHAHTAIDQVEEGDLVDAAAFYAALVLER